MSSKGLFRCIEDFPQLFVYAQLHPPPTTDLQRSILHLPNNVVAVRLQLQMLCRKQQHASRAWPSRSISTQNVLQLLTLMHSCRANTLICTVAKEKIAISAMVFLRSFLLIFHEKKPPKNQNPSPYCVTSNF